MTKIDDIYNNQEIVPKARGSIHTTIIEWFSEQATGKVLDAPAGYGHLSMQLKKLGYDVVGGEIEPEIFAVKDIDCIYTDLNRRIDSEDNAFDYVCCVDGLEHMTDPYRAVEEFARVLKPGGIGIFSIPNYSNIESRFKYFTRGYLEKPKSLETYKECGSNLFNFHNSPLSVTLLDLMFTINGLEITDILRDKVKIKQYLAFPVVFLMKLAATLSSESSRRKNRYDLTLKNEVIFGGNTLIFIVRKTKGS